MTKLVDRCVWAVLGIGLGIPVCFAGVAQATEGLSLQKILKRFQHPHGPTERLRAAEKIAKSGDHAVPALCSLLRHENGRVISHACLALTGTGSLAERAISQLSRMVSDPGTETRAEAIFVLGQIGPTDNPAVSILEGAFQSDDHRLRKRAIQALATIRTPDALRTLALPTLHRGLQAFDATVRLCVTRAVSEMKVSDATTRTALMRASSDADADVRWAAAPALRNIDSHEIAASRGHDNDSPLLERKDVR